MASSTQMIMVDGLFKSMSTGILLFTSFHTSIDSWLSLDSKWQQVFLVHRYQSQQWVVP